MKTNQIRIKKIGKGFDLLLMNKKTSSLDKGSRFGTQAQATKSFQSKSRIRRCVTSKITEALQLYWIHKYFMLLNPGLEIDPGLRVGYRTNQRLK